MLDYRLPDGACVALAPLLLLLGGCSGPGEVPTKDAGASDSGLLDGAFLQDGCVSPSGFAVCGGPADCYPADARGGNSACWGCVAPALGYDFTICTNAALPGGADVAIAPDGNLYVEADSPGVWNTLPFEVGPLFALNGAAARLRYADWGLWTGDALPAPASCPSPNGITLCGGTCGPCKAGDVCTGRSPKHPYGLCVPGPPNWTSCQTKDSWRCPTGQGCFVFKTEADAQAEADNDGFCVPLAMCQAAAMGLPGGAVCR